MEKRLIYAWALDAPAKTLPPGVGLRVGGDTDIQYLILQLHYKMVFPGTFAAWDAIKYLCHHTGHSSVILNPEPFRALVEPTIDRIVHYSEFYVYLFV